MIVIRSAALRRVLSVLIPIVLFPAAVLVGAIWFDDRKYVYISLLCAVLTVLLFCTGFARKQIGSRRLVLVSIMTALASAGRLIPFFKPIAAITILTAIYLGGEAGFFVGAMAAFISNFTFGQGSWTPFQMLAWGLIGYFAGILSGILRKKRLALMIYGALSGIFFSFVMDVWTVLWGGGFTFSLYLSALVTAIPHTILYTVSNVLFLWWFDRPFGNKLTRIQQKYGI